MRDPHKFIPWTNLFFDIGLFFNLSAAHHLPRLIVRLARIFLSVRAGDISAIRSSGENNVSVGKHFKPFLLVRIRFQNHSQTFAVQDAPISLFSCPNDFCTFSTLFKTPRPASSPPTLTSKTILCFLPFCRCACAESGTIRKNIPAIASNKINFKFFTIFSLSVI
jgi:hypothetical protein